MKSRMDSLKKLPRKICQECGQNMMDQEDSYMMECERCLSKKVE